MTENPIAYIRKGRWPGVLVVVEETTTWGIKGYIPIPDGSEVAKAYVRLNHGNYEIVGTVKDAVE